MEDMPTTLARSRSLVKESGLYSRPLRLPLYRGGMSNALRKLLRKTKNFLGRKKAPIPGRTFIRNQGCYNCVSGVFEGPLLEQHLMTTGMRDVRLMLEEGKTHEQAALCIALRNRKLEEKKGGLCMKGAPHGGDFVVPKLLCSRWVGRVGVNKFAGGVDDLPEELADKLGDKDDTRSPFEVSADKLRAQKAEGVIRLGSGENVQLGDFAQAPAAPTDPVTAAADHLAAVKNGETPGTGETS